jgi:hypothetical protein
VLPRDHAVLGIDLAQSRQAAVLADHDSRVIARWRPRCSPWKLGELPVAASIAVGIPVDLREAALRMDAANAARAARAVCHAAGRRVQVVTEVSQ